jgi:hypothetical protein
MFEVKSMEVSRLRLKLDMVYRDLPIEEAEKRFADLTAPPEPTAAPAEDAAPVVLPSKPKRKVVKALIPKTT